MIENNNNNKGVSKQLAFAISGVALLIIAVAGSAYAYFTASATSDAFTGSTLDVKLDKPVVTAVTADGAKGAGLIPIYDGSVAGNTTNQLTTAVSNTNKCIDKNGYTVCKVYSVSIHNSGSTDTTVNFSVSLTSTGTNVTWAKMNSATEFASLKGSDNVLASNVGLAGGATVTKHFVVYLKNTGADQTSTDAGKTISGTVTVTASTGANIQATFQ